MTFRTFAEILLLAAFLASCFGLQWYWNRHPVSVPRRARCRELARFGVLASARRMPLLSPRAIGHRMLCEGATVEQPGESQDGSSSFVRSYFRKHDTRWLRLTLSRAQPTSSKLQREIVVMGRGGTPKGSRRIRLGTFALADYEANSLDMSTTLETIVAQSFVDAEAVMARKSTPATVTPLAAAKSTPATPAAPVQARVPMPANVQRIRKDVVGGTLMNFGHDKRRIGDKPEFTDYFVDISQEDGTVERIWGTGLQDEIKRTDAQRGDRVVVSFLGHKAVEVGETKAKKKVFQIQFAAKQ